MVIWILKNTMAEEEIGKGNIVIWEDACIRFVAKSLYVWYSSIFCALLHKDINSLLENSDVEIGRSNVQTCLSTVCSAV